MLYPERSRKCGHLVGRQVALVSPQKVKGLSQRQQKKSGLVAPQSHGAAASLPVERAISDDKLKLVCEFGRRDVTLVYAGILRRDPAEKNREVPLVVELWEARGSVLEARVQSRQYWLGVDDVVEVGVVPPSPEDDN